MKSEVNELSNYACCLMSKRLHKYFQRETLYYKFKCSIDENPIKTKYFRSTLMTVKS